MEIKRSGPEADSSIPNYAWGRELTDVYQNNPLRATAVTLYTTSTN